MSVDRAIFSCVFAKDGAVSMPCLSASAAISRAGAYLRVSG